MNKTFSFIILTYNEEIHLPRLLESIKGLDAQIFILDSGSSDDTLKVAADFGAQVRTNPFVNHPKQWDFAIKNFAIQTPWTIGLDADQIVTPSLYRMLEEFDDLAYSDVNGIYFNRKNYFQGHWIRYGGYYPIYLLKMFRTGIGYSDLNENMDHRFIVSGKTTIWKNGHILEENLKENDIEFWYSKHRRYSDLIAQEEIEREQKLRMQSIRPNLWGSPDEKKAWLKSLWRRLPLGLRPYLYFGYRMTFKLGIFDGKKGRHFHYLQGLWFRLLVDKKIGSLRKQQKSDMTEVVNQKKTADKRALRFVIILFALYVIFSQGNLFMNSVLSPSGHYYSSYLSENLNYVQWLRSAIIIPSVWLIKLSGFYAIHNEMDILVINGPHMRINYSCLGLGVMSFLIAFVIAFPQRMTSKLKMIFLGIAVIYLLNVSRITIIGIILSEFKSQRNNFKYHHEAFNIIVYICVFALLYFWIKRDIKKDLTTYNLK
ncbi:glycosyltransferase [Pedobacter frigidisoli]|uniref:Glycosyltransferase n=1 Tax=Pedobacter frigidisoli TaxID=2530455 RepID=A0A4R0NZ49_9SPHI|nr:glycosyltransferase [Pedobacter frigidisoli]TCD07711.1 glycosyltransferase [Pedobacter frigidisoli]